MMSDYYSRTVSPHSDGSPVFQNAADREVEEEVARAVEAAWGCKLARFGALAALDWYAERHGRLVGLLELKSRTHERARYPTVFLNVRKWLALTLGSVGLGVSATFVVRFHDGTFWIPVNAIEASNVMIGGCKRIVKSTSDIEPIIEIPIDQLRKL